MFLTDESLDNAKITHGFFGRRGGVSGGIYESLNCGVGTQDAAENVARNRALVCAALGAVPEKLVTLYQVHSATCVRVHESLAAADRPRADAMVSDVPGLVLGILTADCAPVLLYGEKSGGAPVIGAAHAGWGGALKGVLESTVAEMKRRGASEGSLRAVVGPCIRQESYEVGEVFRKPFLKQEPANEVFFRPAERAGHLMFDLPGYVQHRLKLAGVAPVGDTGVDTYANEADYYSYRRSTHRSEPDYGRQISAIYIAG